VGMWPREPWMVGRIV